MTSSRALLSLAAKYRARYLRNFYELGKANVGRDDSVPQAFVIMAGQPYAETVARFIGAGSEKDIIFVRGTTEAINLVAKSWGKANIRRGDEIILSHLEHHANIVPWQQLIA